MRQTVIGVFKNEKEAQNAVEQLVNDGFTRNNIDVSEDYSNRNIVGSDYDRKDDGNDSLGEKVSNFFSNLFGNDNDNDVRTYSTAAKRGCLVTVHAESPDEAERAADILDLYGAVDIDESSTSYENQANNTYTDDINRSSEDYVSDRTTSDYDANRTVNYNAEDSDLDYNTRRSNLEYDVNRSDVADNRSDVTDESASRPVIEEDLQVGKREVETGRVRLKSRIIERPVEENLRLRYERINVERNPVNRPATEADFNQFEEGTIELTERAEIPVITKEARVVEEVRLGKEVEERTETIRDTVRKTDVDVEREDSDDVSDYKRNR